MTWHLLGSVFQRSALEVRKLTKRVEPTGLYGSSKCLDYVAFEVRPCDSGCNTITGHFSERHEHELGRIGVAFADQTLVEPLVGDAFQSAEEMKLGGGSGIPPLGIDQMLGEMEQEGRSPQIPGVAEVEVYAFADDACVGRVGRANQIGCQFENRVLVELGGETALWAGRHGTRRRAGSGSRGGHDPGLTAMNLDSWRRFVRLHNDGAGGEVEWDSEDIGVFDAKEALFRSVHRRSDGARGQRPVRIEAGCRRRVHAEDMGDRIGVPAFCQH